MLSVAERRIAICMSAYDGLNSPLLLDLLRLGLRLGKDRDAKYLPMLVPRLHGATCLNAAIVLSRETVDAAEVREDLTHILWIDWNVMIDGEQAVKLLDSVDPWHPAVFARSQDNTSPTLPNLWSDDGKRLTAWPNDTLVQVRSAGIAAAAFDADLFTSLKQPWFCWQGENPNANVCRQFKVQSIPIYCHTGVVAKQIGIAPIYGQKRAVRQ